MTENDPAKAEPSSKEAIGSDVDPRTQQALDRIKRALSRRNGDEAVRFFKDATSHGLLPNDDNVLAWLRQALGNDLTEKLISAFAGLPCFYCNKGVIPCDDCNGRGYDADRTLCTECLALGIDRCDFCGGSGWFTIDHVPHAFQLNVIMRRVLAAGKEAEVLLASGVPVVSDSEAAEARKLAAKDLLQVNRLLGVLENMTVAAKREESRHAESAGITRKATAACEALAPKLHGRACQLLGVLADAARAEAASSIRTATRRIAERRAEFYADLASSKSFAGTLLRHPLLLTDTSETPDRIQSATQVPRMHDELGGKGPAIR